MNFRVRVTWLGDIAKINVAHASEESIYALAEYTRDRAKGYCPKKTGRLASSINVQSKSRGDSIENSAEYGEGPFPSGFDQLAKPKSDRTVFVGTNLVYANAIEFGIRESYPIDIKYKKVLSDGTTIFGTHVVHPTTQAQPFMRPAMDDARANAPYILKAKFDETLKGMK